MMLGQLMNSVMPAATFIGSGLGVFLGGKFMLRNTRLDHALNEKSDEDRKAEAEERKARASERAERASFRVMLLEAARRQQSRIDDLDAKLQSCQRDHFRLQAALAKKGIFLELERRAPTEEKSDEHEHRDPAG